MTSLPQAGSHTTSECFDDNIAVEFVDGLLPPEQVARVERHVARCDSCRRVLAELGRSPSIHGDDSGPTLPWDDGAYAMLETGQKVGRFVIINRLGSGGMGVVFAAYDPKLDRKVALKLLRSREHAALSPNHDQMRLLREAQATAQLSHHENVVTIYDYGTFKSEVYIAMEFVEGETLTNWLKRWERHWRDVVGKFLQAGRALAAAHAGGLVHRDFKPDNVLVGNDERVRVMDFGLARSVFADPSVEGAAELARPGPAPPSQVRASPAGKAGAHPARVARESTPRALEHSLTKTGTVLGTPRYMAPEQFSGVVADARSDQFSFCVALYEALYQQHPFEERTAEGLVQSPETTRVKPPPAGAGVPVWLHRALLRGMASEPDLRFPSMDALLREIQLRPRAQPRLRILAPLAVALVAVALAAYLFITKRDTQGDLDNAHTLIVKLEERSEDLNDQIVKLTAELRVVRETLSNPRSTPAAVERLQQELAETRHELELALEVLDKTEKELARYTRRPRVSARPEVRGIRSREVRRAIEAFYGDFAICFREWGERARRPPPLYAVELVIRQDGLPRAEVITAGIEDQVVHECVTGLLGRLRFRETALVTVAQIGFRYDDAGMKLDISLVPGEPAGALTR